MAFDLKAAIAGHSAFFHVTDTVTVTPRNPSGSGMEGLRGHKGAADQERLAMISGTLGLEQVSAIWEVWNAPAVIKVGYILTDSVGKEFLIQAVRYDNATSRWELATSENP